MFNVTNPITYNLCTDSFFPLMMISQNSGIKIQYAINSQNNNIKPELFELAIDAGKLLFVDEDGEQIDQRIELVPGTFSRMIYLKPEDGLI